MARVRKAKIDISGQRFGMLEVIREVPVVKYGWLCKCDCGKETIVNQTYNLICGGTSSCGCLALAGRTTHGLTKSRVYVIWKGMHQRCNNKKSHSYENYGGRGITVHDRWSSFDNFLADMGHPPPKYTLERIDNEKGYGPNNCRWATYTDQLNNRRNNNTITAFGKTQTLTQWAREYEMPFTTLKNRIERADWHPEVALSAPVTKRNRYIPTFPSDSQEPI